MDKRKAGARLGRRMAIAPNLENLEGRLLMAASAGRVRIKELVSGDTVQLVIRGTRKADGIKIDDNGTASSGNITVSLADGTTYTSRRAITQISVDTLNGGDMVGYNLTGELKAARSVTVMLGNGPDQFLANIDGAVNTPDALALMVYGDGGNDQLGVSQTGAMLAGTFFPYLEGGNGDDVLAYRGTGEIKAGAIVAPGMPGGAGNDMILADYQGVIGGSYMYNLTMDGGAGNDKLSNRVLVKAGSWGKIGVDAKTPAMVMGGDGDDHIDYVVTIESSASVFDENSALFGGNGKDTVQRSSKVVVDASSETVSVLA